MGVDHRSRHGKNQERRQLRRTLEKESAGRSVPTMKKQPTKAEEEKHRRKEKKGLHRKRGKTQEEGERRDRTEGGGGAKKEREETHYLLGENKKALRTTLHNIGTI